jgi:hypothetical protein
MSYLEDLGRQSRHVLQLGDVDGATADRVSKAALLASPARFAIAYVDRNGVVAKIDTFSTRVEMTNAWDAMVDGDKIPPTIQQITWIDKSVPVGDGWNMAVNVVSGQFSFTKINWKSAAPWIVVGGALIAGAILLGKKKAPAKAKPRRRASATWRRRITTTWR